MPKKERRLTERFKGFAISPKLSSRVRALVVAGSFTLGFNVEVVNNDAVDLSVGFILDTTDAGCVYRNSALVRFCGATYEVMLAPSFGIGDNPTFSAAFLRRLRDSTVHVTEGLMSNAVLAKTFGV